MAPTLLFISSTTLGKMLSFPAFTILIVLIQYHCLIAETFLVEMFLIWKKAAWCRTWRESFSTFPQEAALCALPVTSLVSHLAADLFLAWQKQIKVQVRKHSIIIVKASYLLYCVSRHQSLTRSGSLLPVVNYLWYISPITTQARVDDDNSSEVISFPLLLKLSYLYSSHINVNKYWWW